MTNKVDAPSKNVKNNWFLLLGVGLVSFGGSLVYLLMGENSPAVGLYFIAASFMLAGVSTWWFMSHQPAMYGKTWQYVAVVAFLEFGAYFGGAIEETRAIGAWLAVGLGFVFYGLLERSKLITYTGAIAALLSLAFYAANIKNMGFWLEIATGVLFVLSALKLKSDKGSSASSAQS